MSFLDIDVTLFSSFIALLPVQISTFFSSVIYLRYLNIAYFAMPIPTATNNSSPLFEPLMDDKNLIIEAQVVKSFFFANT